MSMTSNTVTIDVGADTATHPLCLPFPYVFLFLLRRGLSLEHRRESPKNLTKPIRSLLYPKSRPQSTDFPDAPDCRLVSLKIKAKLPCTKVIPFAMTHYYRVYDNCTILDADHKLGGSLSFEDFPPLTEASWWEMEIYAQHHHPRRRIGTWISMAFAGEFPYSITGLCVEATYCLRRESDGWSRWLILQPEYNRTLIDIRPGAPFGHVELDEVLDLDPGHRLDPSHRLDPTSIHHPSAIRARV